MNHVFVDSQFPLTENVVHVIDSGGRASEDHAMRIVQQIVVVSAVAMTFPAIAQEKPEFGALSTIRLDSVSKLHVVGTIEKNAARLAFGPNKNRIAIIGRDTPLDVLDATTFKPIKQLVPDQKPTGFAFSADGNYLAWSDKSNRAQILNLRNYKAIDIDAGGPQCSVAFSPNGKLLATGVYGTEAKLWETATGQPVGSIATGEIIGGLTIAFSPDGRLIAVGNRNAFTRVFEISSGETVCTLSKRASHELKFNPDGKTLSIAYDDGSVAFWEVPNGKLVRSRGTSAEQIYSLDWSPDGSILVTAGLRGKITLWDTRDLSVLKELDAPEWVIQARFSPDGSRLFTAGGTQVPSPDRKVTVWGIDPMAGK